jgi:hypothetical protein
MTTMVSRHHVPPDESTIKLMSLGPTQAGPAGVGSA